MARKKYTDPCRRRAQPAQNVLPMDIEVIELFDDYLHDGKGVKAMHLLYDTAFSVDFAEGIEVPEDIIPHVQELEIFEQPDDIIHDEEDLGAAGLAVICHLNRMNHWSLEIGYHPIKKPTGGR